MKLSCCCGVVTGFILALLLSGGVYWFFYCKNNPESAAENIEQIEDKWEGFKDGGDDVIKKVKKASSYVPSSESKKIKEKIEEIVD